MRQHGGLFSDRIELNLLPAKGTHPVQHHQHLTDCHDRIGPKRNAPSPTATQSMVLVCTSAAQSATLAGHWLAARAVSSIALIASAAV